MSSPAKRQNILELIEQTTQAGSRLDKACDVIGIKVRTIQRWKTNATGVDARVECHHSPVNRLSEQEEQIILDTCNSPEYAHLPPSQIVPLLADKGVYIGSESTIYRCLRNLCKTQDMQEWYGLEWAIRRILKPIAIFMGEKANEIDRPSPCHECG